MSKLTVSPPRQLRAGAAPTKLGKPRVALPVSVQSTDTLWDAAAALVPASPPPVPHLELEIPPQPRRRVRKDHLARCITLQHGMLRESISAGGVGEDDMLDRLSLYDDPLEWNASQRGPQTAPVLGPGIRAASQLPPVSAPLPAEEEEYFPTMAEILAAQDAEDALEAQRAEDERAALEDGPDSPHSPPHRAQLHDFRFPATPSPSATAFPPSPGFRDSRFPASPFFPPSPSGTHFPTSRPPSTVASVDLFFQPDPDPDPAFFPAETRERSPSPSARNDRNRSPARDIFIRSSSRDRSSARKVSDRSPSPPARKRAPSPPARDIFNRSPSPSARNGRNRSRSRDILIRSPSPPAPDDDGAQYITIHDADDGDTRTLYAETIHSLNTSTAAHLSHVPPTTAGLSPPPSAVPSISPTIAYEQVLDLLGDADGTSSYIKPLHLSTLSAYSTTPSLFPLPPTAVPPPRTLSPAPTPPPKTHSVLRLAQRVQAAREEALGVPPERERAVSTMTLDVPFERASTMTLEGSVVARPDSAVLSSRPASSVLSPSTDEGSFEIVNIVPAPAATVPAPPLGHTRQRSATTSVAPAPPQNFYYSASTSTSASDVSSSARAFHRPSLPEHPAQHVRGGSASHARKVSITSAQAQTVVVRQPAAHQRNESVQPAPSSFKFAAGAPRPGMARSQSDQTLRQHALLGALGPAAQGSSAPPQVKASSMTRAERAALAPPSITRSAPTTPPTALTIPSTLAGLSAPKSAIEPRAAAAHLAAPRSAIEPRTASGYFDSDEEAEEDALDALKREMMEWRIGVASAWSEGKDGEARDSVKLRARGKPDTPMDLMFATDAKSKKVLKKRAVLDSKPVCTSCGNELDSGECILAHSGDASEASARPPVRGAAPLVRRASDRRVGHGRSESAASSGGRPVQRGATQHERTDSSPTVSISQGLLHGRPHDRRDSLAKLNSVLFAAPAPPSPSVPAQYAASRTVAQHERTVSTMSSMSAASSFFSSDPSEMAPPSGRSFASAAERLNGASPKSAKSNERFPAMALPLKPAATAPTSVRKAPSDERFAVPLPPSMRTTPSTERFASAERFAAFRSQFGANSDSAHSGARFVGAAAASDLSHSTSAYHAASEQSHTTTVVAYASASAESSSGSYPPTPADADWEYAFSSRPNRTPTTPHTPPSRQRSQDVLRRGLAQVTISSTPGPSTVELPLPDEPVPSGTLDGEPRSASRWSEDSTRQQPPRVPSKQASRTNLARAPSVSTRAVAATATAAEVADSAPPAQAEKSGGGGFAGAIKRLRLKSLPSKPKGGSGGGFAGLARLGTLVVKNKSSTQEMRSGWMG